MDACIRTGWKLDMEQIEQNQEERNERIGRKRKNQGEGNERIGRKRQNERGKNQEN